MRKILSVVPVLALAGFLPVRALADTCIGNCGTLGANGVVTASPFSSDYQFISTSDGVHGAGRIAGVGANETDEPVNGSEFFTSSFPAAAGDNLDFFFNYVTSDGAGFSDYSFAELLSGSLGHVAWLFTARTQEIGNTSPGFGLPANDSTLTPATTAIIPGAPDWSPLGVSSGSCFDTGCGYTGWIESTYTIVTPGNYILKFGVTNWTDNAFHSGLAFDGATIGGVPIEPPVPEPGTLFLLTSTLGVIAVCNRYRKNGSKDSEASV